jgi:dUTP pyrophosphatase
MSDDRSLPFIGVLLPDPDVRDIPVKLPYKEPGNNGWDIFSIEEAVIGPGERVLINTGLRCDFPDSYYALIKPRSGLAVKNGVDVLAGVIDTIYRGEIKVCLINLDKEETITLPVGSKIAQMLIQREIEVEFGFVNSISETVRGEKGFGSSG